MIVRENGNSLARRHGVAREPTANGLRHSTQLGVGVALHRVWLLDLNRNILRPALSAFDEAIVKSGHQCGKYTRKADGVARAPSPANAESANIQLASNMLGF
jgi:hypothetical protein